MEGPNATIEKVRALMAELFPNSRLEALPPDHPVWTAQVKLQPDHVHHEAFPNIESPP